MICVYEFLCRGSILQPFSRITISDNNLTVCVSANQLGESVDDIIEKMDSYGKKDILTPFDENEEPDSEDEDGEEDDEEEDEAAERSIDAGADDLALEIQGIGLSPDSKQLKDTNVSILMVFQFNL